MSSVTAPGGGGSVKSLCLQHDQDRVRAVTVWHADRGMTDAAPQLQRLLRSRMPS